MSSFVLSKLYYCSTVWSNTSKHNINNLQLVQNIAARVDLGLKKFDHISQAIKSLNWLPVNDRIYLNDAVMMYKCIKKLVPNYLFEKFTLRSQIHTNRDFKIQRRGRQRKRQKKIGLISKTTTLHVHHAFLYISFLFLHDYDVKMPNFAFYRGRKQATTKLYFSF